MWLIVRQLPMSAGLWDAPIALRDLAEAIRRKFLSFCLKSKGLQSSLFLFFFAHSCWVQCIHINEHPKSPAKIAEYLCSLIVLWNDSKMPAAFSKYTDTALVKNLTLFVYFRVQLAVFPFILCIGVSIPPHQKHHPHSLLPSPPPLNLQTIQAPFLGNPPIYIGFSWAPSLKVGFFSEPPKHQSFSSLRPSYLLS